MAEAELIEAIERALERRGDRIVRWVGDDAAVVRARPVAATSIDTIADGVHFERDTHSPGDIGWKALAQALSDLAAMGADPGEAYVSLALPAGVGAEEALQLVDGMETLAGETGTTIAGGDVVAAAALVVTVAVTGWADAPENLVSRAGARPGDLVGVTGTLGASGAGLLLLQGTGAAPAERDELIARQRRPVPLLAAGSALANAGVTAMIDVSDGLATDAAHIARRSDVGLRIRLGELPISPGVAAVAEAAGEDPAVFAARAGDDYELLFTAPEERRAAVESAVAVTWLGGVASGAGVELVAPDGGVAEGIAGFEHT